MEVALEVLGGVVGGQHAPLVASAALVADGRPAAVGGAVVGHDAAPGLDAERVIEGARAEDVQVVLALGGLAPQGAPDQGIDAVGTDQTS